MKNNTSKNKQKKFGTVVRKLIHLMTKVLVPPPELISFTQKREMDNYE